jgi:uncharacterized repeat protein (TIGR03837 family)
MKRLSTPPHWFNLEYLSAESWVEGCHGLASTHPQLGLKKVFFFPGFTPSTGGLLREQRLLTRRDSFLQTTAAVQDFFNQLQVAPQSDERIISLFSYENSAIGSLLDSWVGSLQPILCLVPASKILPSINAHLGTRLDIHDEYCKGALRLRVIPFLKQDQYDHLLWACDINFIRGEDSFVRAQWAGKPFVWHIYPQDDEVHLEKLNAFLDRYLLNLSPSEQAVIKDLWMAWNKAENCTQAWQNYISCKAVLDKHSQQWCKELCTQPDLASNLVQHCAQ